MIREQEDWQRMRAPANEDDPAIDLTSEGDWDQKVSSAIEIKSNDHNVLNTNDIFIALAAGAAADKTLTWRLFAWSVFNGMIQQAAYGTAKTGAQAVVKYPNKAAAANIFWCDTLVVTGYSWPLAVKATPGGGNDSVAMITLQTFEWAWWFMQIEDADGATGDEAGDVSVWWRHR